MGIKGYSQEHYEQKALSLGFKLILPFINGNTKTAFQCLDCKIIKHTKPNQLHEGGCRHCHLSKITLNRLQNGKHTLETISNLFKDKNFTLLQFNQNKFYKECSEAILVNYTTFIINCDICREDKFINYLPDFNRHPTCTNCIQVLQENNIKEKLLSLGFELISGYTSFHSQLTIKSLSCGHEKTINASSALHGHQCEICNKHDRFPIEIVKDKCLAEGFIYLDNYYNNINEKHNFECENKHIISYSVSEIVNKKSKCKECYGYGFINEKLTKIFISQLFKNIKIKQHPKIKCEIYNGNIKIRNYIYPDILINDNIIIEYNGDQHYEPISYGNMTKEKAILNFNNQQIRDRWLRDYCKENNIYLIEIDGRKYKGSNIKIYLSEALKDLL